MVGSRTGIFGAAQLLCVLGASACLRNVASRPSQRHTRLFYSSRLRLWRAGWRVMMEAPSP